MVNSRSAPIFASSESEVASTVKLHPMLVSPSPPIGVNHSSITQTKTRSVDLSGSTLTRREAAFRLQIGLSAPRPKEERFSGISSSSLPPDRCQRPSRSHTVSPTKEDPSVGWGGLRVDETSFADGGRIAHKAVRPTKQLFDLDDWAAA